MNIIVGERCSGKTTELIKKSAATGIYILTINHAAADFIYYQAKQMGLTIPFPITVRQFLRERINGNNYCGSSIARYGVLIDDADLVLQQIFGSITVHEIAINDRGDNVSYLKDLRGKTDVVEEDKDLYEGDDVLVKEPWDPRIVDGYSGAFCSCGYILHIKTPKIKAFHAIKCPKCGHIVNLFCGQNGEKVSMDILRDMVPTIGTLGD